MVSKCIKSCQNRIRELLESNLHSNSTNALPLHAATRSATWFEQHLKSTLAANRLVELASNMVHLDLKILALLSCLPGFITDSNQPSAILESISGQLMDDGTSPFPDDIDAISRLFEDLLRDIPPWLQSIKEANEDQWKELICQMNCVISNLRAGENSARAVSRQNGRGLVLAKREVIKDVSVLREGRGRKGLGVIRGLIGGRSSSGRKAELMDTLPIFGDGVYDDRRYSCSAAWDI